MTDDTRQADEDIVPPEEEEDAAPDSAEEAAPEADEPEIDWQAKAKSLEAAMSRQGRELGELRQQIAAIQPRPPVLTRDVYEQAPPEVRQYLDYREREYQSLEAAQVEAQYGSEYVQALDTFRRAVQADPSVRGQAKAFELALSQLAAAAEQEETPAPAPKARPKAPTPRQIDTNRADAMPSADISKLKNEAEQKQDTRSLQAYIGALVRGR